MPASREQLSVDDEDLDEVEDWPKCEDGRAWKCEARPKRGERPKFEEWPKRRCASASIWIDLGLRKESLSLVFVPLLI